MISVIGKDEILMDNLGEMKRQIRNDKQEQYKYDTFKRNIVEEFLRAHCNDKQIKNILLNVIKLLNMLNKNGIKKLLLLTN